MHWSNLTESSKSKCKAHATGSWMACDSGYGKSKTKMRIGKFCKVDPTAK